MQLVQFGEILKTLRLAKGLTQDDMAKMLDVTTNHYQKIEYGKVNVSIAALDMLATFFGVTTDYLLGRE